MLNIHKKNLYICTLNKLPLIYYICLNVLCDQGCIAKDMIDREEGVAFARLISQTGIS